MAKVSANGWGVYGPCYRCDYYGVVKMVDRRVPTTGEEYAGLYCFYCLPAVLVEPETVQPALR